MQRHTYRLSLSSQSELWCYASDGGTPEVGGPGQWARVSGGQAKPQMVSNVFS